MAQDLKALTALRFFAAMWVVSYHFWPALSLSTPMAVDKGYLGVELFFVLSGFILSHVYLKPFGERRFSFPNFLWARVSRIYPVHLATLAGMGLMIAAAAAVGIEAGDKVLIWQSLPAQLTLTQAWGLALQGGWNHPSWSISAEWFAYLMFPVFAWMSWRLRQRPMIALLLALGLVAGLETGFERIAGFPLTHATIAWGALRIVPCFALGCAVYLLWSARPLLTENVAVAAVAAVVTILLLAIQLRAPDCIFVMLFGGLIFGLASLTSAQSSILTGPFWIYLGEVSFAVYMVCIPWQIVFERVAHRLPGLDAGSLPLPVWLVEYFGVIPVAIVVHHLVERPARDAMRRYGAAPRDGHPRLQAPVAALARD